VAARIYVGVPRCRLSLVIESVELHFDTKTRLYAYSLGNAQYSVKSAIPVASLLHLPGTTFRLVPDENVWQVIEEIASRHRELSHRLSEEIIRLKGVPDAGSFPPTYTRFNDLAVDYIAPKIAQELEETLTIIQKAKSEYHGHGELDNLLNQLADEVQAEIEALQRELHEAHPQECLK